MALRDATRRRYARTTPRGGQSSRFWTAVPIALVALGAPPGVTVVPLHLSCPGTTSWVWNSSHLRRRHGEMRAALVQGARVRAAAAADRRHRALAVRPHAADAEHNAVEPRAVRRRSHLVAVVVGVARGPLAQRRRHPERGGGSHVEYVAAVSERGGMYATSSGRAPARCRRWDVRSAIGGTRGGGNKRADGADRPISRRER